MLYQNQSDSKTFKPLRSEAGISHGSQSFKETLPCQVLLDFYKPQRPDTPTNLIIESNIYKYSDVLNVTVKDIAWSLARLNLSSAIKGNISNILYPEVQDMPSWKASNSILTEEGVPIK